MPFDEAAFTRDAAELVAQGDRVPAQREADAAPHGWFDPEWVRVETVMWADDGSVTRSAGWVRREEWFASMGSERMTG